MAIIGRYVLPAAIFPILTKTPPGKGGEIQLTDGLLTLCKEQGLWGLELDGLRYDAGDRLGYLEANLAYALRRPELADGVRALLRKYLEA